MRSFVLSLAAATALASAQPQAYTTIDYPGAVSTWARGVNDSGDIVGYYLASGAYRSFLFSKGAFSSIDYPDAKATYAYGINSGGDIVGYYVDSADKQHGFVLQKGKFNSVDYPGAALTGVFGINSAGVLTGHIQMPGKPMQGYLLRGTAWTVLDYRPDAPSNTMNCYFGVNDAGVAVGHWGTRGTLHGVLYKDGKTTELNFGGGGSLETLGINNAGDIVGDFKDAAQAVHGFFFRNGRFIPIDVPDAVATTSIGLNNNGDIVGRFTDAKGVTHGYLTRLAMPARAAILTVDDDGEDCPGSLRTIQEAVAQAPPGATIRVCPGTYRGTVNITGHAKDGLRLLAVGGVDEVVLQGDYTERDGFHLEDVANVTIRGFTVRDFGNQATNATQWGDGGDIFLKNVTFSTIEFNRLMNGDMVGVWLTDSANNVVQNNFILMDKPTWFNCGIHIGEAKTANNLIRQNAVYGAQMAGLMVVGAGPGNQVVENVFTNGGRYGIHNNNSPGTWIEGNRVSYNRGPWATSPYAADWKNVGIGINIVNSDQVTVIDNRARNNSGVDLYWDGKGTNVFEANACETSTPPGGCAR